MSEAHKGVLDRCHCGLLHHRNLELGCVSDDTIKFDCYVGGYTHFTLKRIVTQAKPFHGSHTAEATVAAFKGSLKT